MKDNINTYSASKGQISGSITGSAGMSALEIIEGYDHVSKNEYLETNISSIEALLKQIPQERVSFVLRDFEKYLTDHMRRSDRRNCNILVKTRGNNRRAVSLNGTATNISRDGVFLSFENCPSVSIGSEIIITFKSQTGITQKISRILGEVKRITKNGLGIRFMKIIL